MKINKSLCFVIISGSIFAARFLTISVDSTPIAGTITLTVKSKIPGVYGGLTDASVTAYASSSHSGPRIN